VLFRTRPSLALLTGFALLGYWVLLAAGVHAPVATQVPYAALTLLPGLAVLFRAVRVREDRLPWALLGVGLTIWGCGCVVAAVVEIRGDVQPFPGVADACWLAMYPCAIAAFGILAHRRLPRRPFTVAVDAAMVMLVLSAVATALIVPSVIENASGLSGLAQTVNLAYPLADLALLSAAGTALLLVGWRRSVIWRALASGALALTVADAMWALQASSGPVHPLTTSAIYPLWPCLAAVGAWASIGRRKPRAAANEDVHIIGAVFAAGLVALALLVLNDFVAIPRVSLALATLGLLAAIHRTGVTLLIALRASRGARRERTLVDDVRAALAANELRLHFQPLVGVGGGRVEGAEALLRWSRDGANVAPDEFLPAVERSELIGDLTDFVVDSALRELATWRESGHDIGLSVNLAAPNLADTGLPGRVDAALRRHGVPASSLTLEITETATVTDDVVADDVLADLKRVGVDLSIDDFGTGHSSLTRLSRFPIDEVKIDRSFVMEMHTAKRPIVATAIQLAHSLGLRVVAEGIEESATLDALRAMDCDLAQGYHVARPMPPEDFATWLERRAAAVTGGALTQPG
jgi:EAL domain-containing protein (putative c-di-GMP-specific phosphodiesterase class I)